MIAHSPALRPQFQLLTFALVLTFLGAAHADDFLGTRTSYFERNRYNFDLSAKMLATAPAWKSGADFPPLSPLRARDVALQEAKKLAPAVKSWSADKITLEHIDQTYANMPSFWIYLVDCVDDDGPYSGPERVLTVPVMMNGVVIPPKIEPVK